MGNIDNVIRYENGEMDDQEMVDFFQDGITTGLVWRLQGSYGRTATALIAGGHCFDPNAKNFEE
jgi:hypothetical protein